jgi:hypothetical protein
MKEISQMDPIELVAEAKSVRSGINDSVLRLGEIYQTLYSHARRHPEEDLSGVSLKVASSGARFTGLFLQSLRRVDTVDRVFESFVQRQREDAQRKADEEVLTKNREQRRQVREAQRRQDAPSMGEAIDDLYGEETV